VQVDEFMSRFPNTARVHFTKAKMCLEQAAFMSSAGGSRSNSNAVAYLEAQAVSHFQQATWLDAQMWEAHWELGRLLVRIVFLLFELEPACCRWLTVDPPCCGGRRPSPIEWTKQWYTCIKLYVYAPTLAMAFWYDLALMLRARAISPPVDH